jgi:hypothetical protein
MDEYRFYQRILVWQLWLASEHEKQFEHKTDKSAGSASID